MDTLSKELKIEEKILSQKSTTESAKSPAAASSGGETRASIFGSAKPVDTAAREREIEKKLMRGKSATSQDRVFVVLPHHVPFLPVLIRDDYLFLVRRYLQV